VVRGAIVSKRKRPPRVFSGRRTLYVLPSIPDDAPAEFKNALAIRNAANVEMRCPDCGAEPYLVGRVAPGAIAHLVFEHEHGCHALTDGSAA
jgi:hypothetical protein